MTTLINVENTRVFFHKITGKALSPEHCKDFNSFQRDNSHALSSEAYHKVFKNKTIDRTKIASTLPEIISIHS